MLYVQTTKTEKQAAGEKRARLVMVVIVQRGAKSRVVGIWILWWSYGQQQHISGRRTLMRRAGRWIGLGSGRKETRFKSQKSTDKRRAEKKVVGGGEKSLGRSQLLVAGKGRPSFSSRTASGRSICSQVGSLQQAAGALCRLGRVTTDRPVVTLQIPMQIDASTLDIGVCPSNCPAALGTSPVSLFRSVRPKPTPKKENKKKTQFAQPLACPRADRQTALLHAGSRFYDVFRPPLALSRIRARRRTTGKKVV